MEDIEDLKTTDVHQGGQISFLKDSIVQIMEDRKIIDDVNWLRKKFESLSNLIQSMNFGDHEDGSKVKQQFEDRSKYVEHTQFLEFQKNLGKELANMVRRIDENKRSIDDIYEVLKERPTIKDLKNLEDYLLNKQDELKIACSRRFADKMDTHKNTKYLETQVISWFKI